MSIRITQADRDLEKTFLSFAKLAGITQDNEKVPRKLTFDGVVYRVHVTADDAIAKSMGGKARIFRLLRYAALIQYISATPQGASMAQFMLPTFKTISDRFPILRSYYEGTALAARHHVWIRW